MLIYLSKHERAGSNAQLHAELLAVEVALVVEVGGAPVARHHAHRVVRGRRAGHGAVHRPVAQQLREQQRG